MPFQRDIIKVGKLRFRGSLVGHTRPPQGPPPRQPAPSPVPYTRVIHHRYGITLHFLLQHFNKFSAHPPITHYWKGTIFKNQPTTKKPPPTRQNKKTKLTHHILRRDCPKGCTCLKKPLNTYIQATHKILLLPFRVKLSAGNAMHVLVWKKVELQRTGVLAFPTLSALSRAVTNSQLVTW